MYSKVVRKSVHDRDAVERFRHLHRIDPFVIRKFFNSLYKQALNPGIAILELPLDCQDAFRSQFQVSSLKLKREHKSQQDGASKLIFATHSGDSIESVILRNESGRCSVCVSSQVGCAVGCLFCATGQMSRIRNLSPDEIVDQILLVNQRLQFEQRRAKNIVFMGMGEPLNNLDSLITAIEHLTDASRFNYPLEKLMISTVGVPERLLKLVQRFPKLNIAVSLHSVRQSLRDELIPVSRIYPLQQLRRAIQAINVTQMRPLMLEYLLLKDINDHRADADELILWMEGLHVHINLLPYNPIANQPMLKRTSSDKHHEFADQLRRAGYTVTTRYSLGQDIGAGCGQLILPTAG